MDLFDYNVIMPSMRRTVRWVRSLGFETTDSGDGITNVEAGMECALDFPHVVCKVDDPNTGVERAKFLHKCCKDLGLPVPTKVSVEFSYNPEDVGVILLIGLTDEILPEIPAPTFVPKN